MFFNVCLVFSLHLLAVICCPMHHYHHNATRGQNENYTIPKEPIKSRQGDFGWKNCPSCGILPRTRIVGGRFASITEFPWMVSILKNGIQHCGGSVINNHNVLTAAHCIKGHDVSKLLVVASVTDVTDENAFRIRVHSAKYNENFDPITYDFDCGILYLERTIPLDRAVRPICLPNPKDDPTGQTAVVSGWGAMKETDTVAQQSLRKVGLPVVPNDQCQQAKGLKTQKITDRMMCAGYLDGSMDACIGDSGGPLIWFDRVWKQIGIVSWGIGCARPNYYGVYARVASMLDWIAANADGNC